MQITSIVPAIKVFGENDSEFIALGDNIRIVSSEGKVFSGIFLYMKMGIGDVEDTIVIEIGNEDIEINLLDIVDVEKLS